MYHVTSSPASTKAKVREAHRRIMVLNHPDKGKHKPDRSVICDINSRAKVASNQSLSVRLQVVPV